jgi:magnesium chelatase family protein
MLTTLRSFTLDGITARALRVEVDVLPGLPSFTIVGLPDAAVREARERVRAALVNSGFEFPLRRIVVKVSPAGIRKAAPAMDLPIAAAILDASGQLDLGHLREAAFLGELALDGSTRPTDGALAIAEATRRREIATLVLPSDDGPQAALVDELAIVPLDSLAQLRPLAAGEPARPRPEPMRLGLEAPPGSPDLADLRGQPELRRSLEIAAAGGHSLLMAGPPGSGKALAASRLPSILPPLLPEEALEVARIASATGRLNAGGWRGGRPFRAPHHTISATSLLGGAVQGRPGEVTLAHRGVLFLDEIAEFGRGALVGLREPLASSAVTVCRGDVTRIFPAAFMLVAAAMPCPCGRGPEDPDCSCAPHKIERYGERVSAAFAPARPEINITVRRPTGAEIGDSPGESSAAVADRVLRARERQERRLGPGRCNAQMTPSETRSCPLETDAAMRIADVYAGGRLSGWNHDRVLRLAQTLADLEAAAVIEERHIDEALRRRRSAFRPEVP